MRPLARAVALGALMSAGAAQAGDPGLLFSVTGEQGALASFAAGRADPIFATGVGRAGDGAKGAALAMADNVVLAWAAPGNIYAQRGTMSFFFRPRQPLGATPFPIMRAGSADGSDWDMAWLRIDWNGHGFDAFVTDTGLARSRVSFKVERLPRPTDWIHLAFAWDETSGVRLWVNGKPAARKDIKAVYDSGLYGIGPFQRIVGPWQVQSRYNFMRGGDIDELRVYDRMLTDGAVAALAAHRQPVLPPAPSLDDPALREAWWLRHGWNREGDVPAYLADPVTRIRKVEFTDARDIKAKMFKGIDGIRETTWPGVYNRSRLPGRNDYFQLPDWNTYSEGGKQYTLTLPDEPWNRIEINGPAHGQLVRTLGDGQGVLMQRAPGQERTSTQFATTHQGGEIRFDNKAQETPIEEIAAYHVGPGRVPEGVATLSYTVDVGAALDLYPNLAPLRSFIDGRFVAGERSAVAALPAGAPRREGPARPKGMPVVHVLVPGDFRSPLAGEGPTRFSYGWQNMDAGLDGVALELPALKVSATHQGLLPLNIRVRDPLWPERDLLDVNVSVKPNEARTLWLDTRDLMLPPTGNLMLTISAAGGGFDAASLDGMRVRLVFKPAEEAKKEHIADRLEQARDNLAFLVEENPNIRPYTMWHRFELDVSDVLRIDPSNEFARALWNEKNPEQPFGPFVQPAPPAGVPLWAFRQVEMLKLYRKFVNWWIDERQVENGEFGGGLSDDTDLVNSWVPLALMGVQPERVTLSQRKVLDATYENGMWANGLGRIQADELHSYEEGINSVGQFMQMSWGDPTAIERGMEVARNYPRLFTSNPAGHTHINSSYFSGTTISHEQAWAEQRTYGFLLSHPGLLLVDYNGAPATRALILRLLDGYLAHGKQDERGLWSYPATIAFDSDKGSGNGMGESIHVFWAAYQWTGDAKYLRPIQALAGRGNLGALRLLNADLLARLPGGPALADKMLRAGDPGEGKVDRNYGSSNDSDVVRLLRWQTTGDKREIADIFGRELQFNMKRFPVMTDAHLWTDRVNVSNEMLQRTRMGGVAHRRNSFYPGNLVTWRFANGASGEDVALLIPQGDPKHFKVIAYNLSDKPVTAFITGAQLAAGTWSVTSGVDTNDDDRADNPSAPRSVRLERGRSVELNFAPHQTVVYEFKLEQPGSDPATRADIGLSPDDLVLKDRVLGIRVHSLGAKPTPAGLVLVEDAAGKAIASVRFPELAAPLDLLPKTADVQVTLPERGDPAQLRVRLTLDGAPDEVTDANNVAPLVRPTLETDRIR
ncbi:LamG-like jellyroll fold domain-containing protein [Massilia horti]|uniref:LamG domain-containing protein n=1 Tax=Massilia horti TaxID=2562153 RepID=A0A4Y9SYK0_9BURK|nr:LamG-like jellyroll fold domain-containing protein [Massilia horti]TFW31725.1 LamG domain-containing protein [Massilia horti]